MTHLTLYSKPDCHLCAQMKEVVQKVARRVPLVLEEVDISRDEELTRAYGMDIPLLMIEGQRAAKYRITEDDLVRVLDARVPRPE